ncbi:MAG TPA: FMN-binding protein [Streptosporangiaceae bacterium]|nr:FMN-binding protein [Streptosporangiaceae bacterium]
MRRAVLAFGSTVAGLILLLSFRSHSGTAASAGVGAAGSGSGSSASAAGSGSSGGSSGSMSGSGATAPASPSAPAVSAAPGSKVVTGDVINSPYGPSQVAVTLTGNKITKVTVLQHTDDGMNSQEIDGNALPKLTAETLTAQSAKIDAVSGASYTSAGYIKSLQSALDKA